MSATERTTVPDHVPQERVYDFDYTAPPGHEVDVHLAWNTLHDEGVPDILWTPRCGGHWIATRADDIDRIQLDHDLFSTLDVTVPKGSAGMKLYPLEIDPPEHAAYRALLSPRFGPRPVKELAGTIREYCNNLIDDFIDKGECDFVYSFAKRLPIDLFLSLVDLPLEDRDTLLRYAEISTRPKTLEEREQAPILMGGYVAKYVEERRKNPGEDLISLVVNAETGGRPYNDEETYGMLFNILFGGLDTVAAMLGFLTWFLADNPGHRRQLIEDPDLIPGAVEELLRRYGIANTARVITRDAEYEGVRFKQGEQVMAPKVLHGLDERRYPDPLTVDFVRNVKDHAGFGAGPHKCAGMHLARMELRIFIQEWLRRIPEFGVKSGERPVTSSGMTNGISYLPLAW